MQPGNGRISISTKKRLKNLRHNQVASLLLYIVIQVVFNTKRISDEIVKLFLHRSDLIIDITCYEAIFVIYLSGILC